MRKNMLQAAALATSAGCLAAMLWEKVLERKKAAAGADDGLFEDWDEDEDESVDVYEFRVSDEDEEHVKYFFDWMKQNNLSKDERLSCVLHYGGYTVREIAEMELMPVRVEAVWGHLRNAKRKLFGGVN